MIEIASVTITQEGIINEWKPEGQQYEQYVVMQRNFQIHDGPTANHAKLK